MLAIKSIFDADYVILDIGVSNSGSVVYTALKLPSGVQILRIS